MILLGQTAITKHYCSDGPQRWALRMGPGDVPQRWALGWALEMGSGDGPQR